MDVQFNMKSTVRLSIKLVIFHNIKIKPFKNKAITLTLASLSQSFFYISVVRISKYCDILLSFGSNQENGTTSSVPSSPIVSNIHPSGLSVLTSVSNELKNTCSKHRPQIWNQSSHSCEIKTWNLEHLTFQNNDKWNNVLLTYSTHIYS